MRNEYMFILKQQSNFSPIIYYLNRQINPNYIIKHNCDSHSQLTINHKCINDNEGLNTNEELNEGLNNNEELNDNEKVIENSKKKSQIYVLPQITRSGITISYSNNLTSNQKCFIRSNLPIYNQFFAPQGVNEFILQPKRIALCISNYNNGVKNSYWNIIIC